MEFKDTAHLTVRDVKRDIKDVERAAEILKSGGLAVIPTETVYGLAADALNPDAVKRIFEAKGRPSDNPLIVHVSSLEQVYPLVREFPENAKRLAHAFWPGPLTMVLPKSDAVPDVTSGGLDTVAIRMPSNEAARAIIERSCPLAAPSANISGLPSPTSYKYVLEDMEGRVDAVCDGGDCAIGVESTVITLCGSVPTVLRPGGVTPEMLRGVIGEVAVSEAVLKPLRDGETAASPGMKYKHYSPKADVTVVRGSSAEFRDYVLRSGCDGVMCFEEERDSFPGKTVVTFGSEDDALSQAGRLYDALRELDERGVVRCCCRDVKKTGVGLAVANRLYRAAGFKTANAVARPVIGLTGPTGAGKGYVCECLKKRGLHIIDTDVTAREVIADEGVLDKIKAAFGGDVAPGGVPDRRLIASRAFSSKENQSKLNAIMHPEIVRRAKEEAQRAIDGGCAGAVIDAPLLFESGADGICDCVVAVIAPKDVRLNRITQRDSITREEALRRMSVQHEDEYYTSRADFVVRSYEPYDVERQIEDFSKVFLRGGNNG